MSRRSRVAETPAAERARTWTFITSHAQVLLAIGQNRGRTVAEIARVARITERSAFRILADLEHSGYIHRTKQGRRNVYELREELPLSEPLLENQHLAELLALVARDLGRQGPPADALDEVAGPPSAP